LITLVIVVLLVVAGAQLAYGPAKNNRAVASTQVTPAGTTTAAVANAPAPVTARKPLQATGPVSPTLSNHTAAPDATTPTSQTITQGASDVATNALARFVQANGATLNLGVATSEPFTSTVNGVVGQYFTNAVLEYHPEYAGTPYAVELSRVGVALARANGLQESAPFTPLPAGTQPDANCWFIQVTRHRLCGGFRDFWRSQGLDFGDAGVSYRESLALFGFPISEEFTDPSTGLTVQYFERGVLTYDGTKAPDDRIHERAPTAAILKQWNFQIIATAGSLPDGG
jgi:hypothetical protein